MARRVLAAVLVAVGVVGLSACAPDTDPSWTPAQWPVVGRMLTAPPPPVDPAGIALAPQRIRNDSVRVEARWAYLPGSQPLNDAVEATVRAAIGEQSTASGVGYEPQVFGVEAALRERGCVAGVTALPAADLLGAATDSHTVVVCEIVHAAGSTFGERLRVVRGSAAAVESDQIVTLYADVATGAVGDGASLIGQNDLLWEDVVSVARRAAGGLSLSQVSPPSDEQRAALSRALQDASFVDGELVVPLPVGFTAPELEGLAGWQTPDPEHPVWVSLPRTSYDPALTEFGRVIADAQGAFAGPTTAGAAFDRTSCDLVPCMALTMDDGPSGLTDGILDALRDRHSAATFFMLGRNAQNRPDTVRRVSAEGHQIGNHTWNHPDLTTLSDERIASELRSTADLLRSLSGQAVSTFRPPYGALNERVLGVAGMPAILWSVDTRDWAGPSDADLLAYSVSAPRIGTIMLMHDIQEGTSRIMPQLLDGLLDRGFSLVTLSKLFDGQIPGGIVRYAP
ncbi:MULTISPECIES: polysaccharide deacetylase family protein [unclassified Microbacterium]|uniref:polysaccharide deacetylase family protein n=1 Tax=unclassified Microbacterium TaxID=2609290 RepID=UPI000C2BC4AA|nr:MULTISPECIES: polysaccharide deacetylase family protein [unclassified Microbacterium]